MRAERAAWLFITPALCALMFFFFLPAAAAFVLSLSDFDIYALADLRNLRWIGFENYWAALHLPVFWRALLNTAWFVVAGVPLSIGASLCAALLLQTTYHRLQALFRTALFAPVVTSLVAVALIWRYLLHTRYGYLNFALQALGLPSIDWLGDPHWAMPAIILFATWKNFGYNMVILFAALQAIPADLYEAASLDGANRLARFRHITLPSLMPTMTMVSIMSMAGYFQLFAEPYVMTQGGPAQSTLSVLYLMYEQGFKWWNLGMASAVAFLLFAIMLMLTLLQVRLTRHGGELV